MKHLPLFHALAVGVVAVSLGSHALGNGPGGNTGPARSLELKHCYPGGADFVPGYTVSVKKLIGARVINPLDDVLGEVVDLYVDRRGCIVMLSVQVGGFLGIGGQQVRLSSDKVKIEPSDRSDDVYVMVRATRDHILTEMRRDGPALENTKSDQSFLLRR